MLYKFPMKWCIITLKSRYLAENPLYIREGVNLSQFSFAIPKPLHGVCVQKRTREAHELPELADTAQGALNWTKIFSVSGCICIYFV
jgi:hypothetical protein